MAKSNPIPAHESRIRFEFPFTILSPNGEKLDYIDVRLSTAEGGVQLPRISITGIDNRDRKLEEEMSEAAFDAVVGMYLKSMMSARLCTPANEPPSPTEPADRW